jgi:hypothetical protein
MTENKAGTIMTDRSMLSFSLEPNREKMQLIWGTRRAGPDAMKERGLRSS